MPDITPISSSDSLICILSIAGQANSSIIVDTVSDIVRLTDLSVYHFNCNLPSVFINAYDPEACEI